MLTISFGARPQQDGDKPSVGDHLYSPDGCDDLAPIAALIGCFKTVRNHRLLSFTASILFKISMTRKRIVAIAAVSSALIVIVGIKTIPPLLTVQKSGSRKCDVT
jgi:hypothetical protein